MASSRRKFREATRTRKVAGSVAALVFAATAIPFSTGAVAAASSKPAAESSRWIRCSPRR
jgi:hypothetical protein